MRIPWQMFLVAAAAVAGVGACAPARRPIDWQAVEREGRLVDKPEGIDVLKGGQQFRWGDGEVELTVNHVGGPLRTGARLFVDLQGADGSPTPFLVDTGTTASFLSSTAPLAREVRIARKATYQVEHGRKDVGHLGYLPTVRMGPLSGRDLAVGITELSHTAREPANVLGLIHIFHTQMEYDGGGWWLRSGATRRPATESGWTLVRLELGTPFVRVRDPSGQEVYAMVDTGANASAAVQGYPEGDYTVLAADGSVALRIPARHTAPWPGLEQSGYKISVVIGMDALSSRPSRLTLDQSAWSFPPRP
ncbi:MAG: aspartyl protease family protein [Planctomycetes bacterium]|nr:aspartyl protease family protein [Planctomycetota bacterium]